MRYTLALALVLLVLIPALLQASASYVITDLGMPGTNTWATGISSSGCVVGYSATSPGMSGGNRALMWANGAMEDLGVLGDPAQGWSLAYGVNDNGQIVGESTGHAFLWEDGRMTDLGALGSFDEPAGYSSRAVDIDNYGRAVGVSSTPALMHPTLWESGTVTDLGPDGDGFAVAYGINDSGQVVGGGFSRAFLWEDGVSVYLDGLGGFSDVAYAIGNTGQIVGQSAGRAVIWQGGAVADLGTLGGSFGCARSINSSGQVVGDASTLRGQTHAFLWEHGEMVDLGTLGGRESSAYGINDSGQIVGYSFTPTGERHAVLWTPVPEPSSIVPLLTGIGCAAWAWKRKSRG